ncbi:hypothetical protein [Amaricoccus sp. W119]|uniref:hypothetical protein n=1 Tax=Amaricoccus sp. W119 TaxID=3391833 RepID=UPI0039A5AAA4
MDLRREIQGNPVGAEVSALYAVVRPILAALLFSLRDEVVQDYGGHEKVLLRQLARNRNPNDGEPGVCFEYAVHDAIINRDPEVLERINDALHRHCRIRGDDPQSLLFGAEKSGRINLIQSVRDSLTDNSRLLSGVRGQPVRLKRHIETAAAAFRRRPERNRLPSTIGDLWKADLFVGRPQPDQWVGTSVKINRTQLQAARGLRLAIIPSAQGEQDAIYHDEMKNLIVVPVPYDQGFMEVFYGGWETVVAFIDRRAEMPPPVLLSRPAQRHVAQALVDRRDFPVVDVVEALGAFAQPFLLQTRPAQLNLDLYRAGGGDEINSIISPIARFNAR